MLFIGYIIFSVLKRSNLFTVTGAADDGYSLGLDDQKPVGKIGAKKQRKLEMKEEKRMLREVWNFLLHVNSEIQLS